MAFESIKDAKAWCVSEFGRINFGDKRLNSRFIKTASSIAHKPMDSINRACDDWAGAKAAYRLFDNAKVSAQEILSVHRQKTFERMHGLSRVLVIQDTTFLNYANRDDIEGLGPISSKRGVKGPMLGLVMHTALAVNPDVFVHATEQQQQQQQQQPPDLEEGYEIGRAVPLGIVHQKIWSRKGFIESKKTAPRLTIDKKESYKWIEAVKSTEDHESRPGVEMIHVSDREGDLFEYMAYAQASGAFFLTRAKYDRNLVLSGGQSLWEKMEAMACIARFSTKVSAGVVRKNDFGGKTRRYKRSDRTAKLEVRCSRVTLAVPGNVASKSEQSTTTITITPLALSAVFISEIDPPKDSPAVEWMLLTNVPTETTEDALERVRWYKLRWHIEEFHKVLKSGLRIEQCGLESADRLIRYASLCSVIAWRLYWMTKLSRASPNAPCDVFLASHEWKALYCKTRQTNQPPDQPPSVREAVHWIASLGGFLDRRGDGEPGVKSVWEGWQRLNYYADAWLIFTPNQEKRCG